MATHFPLKDGTQWFDKAKTATSKKARAKGGRQAKRLNTVNVIEQSGEYDLTVSSWNDNKAGNKAAEAYFRKVVKGQYDDAEHFSTEEIEDALEEGVIDEDDWKVFIIHS